MPQLDRTAIVCVSHISLSLAQTIASELLGEKKIFTIGLLPTEVSSAEVSTISSIADLVATSFSLFDAWIFIGAMGICVRSIAPYITDKHHDPAVVNVDSTGRYVVSVLSGHVGGANDLTCLVASAIGAEPVVTTQSDRTGLWALDTLADTYGWKAVSNTGDMNRPISLFVNGARTALVLETAGRGEDVMERTCPSHV
uniref:cobalamin biosynthesis central domain-containing protein n=1 Tax=Porphyromonas loveana TaxID=1884669 RepID=UPI0035A09B5C